MPHAVVSNKNLQRDTLRKIQQSKQYGDKQKQLAALKLAYSEDSKLLTSYINKLVNVNRIYLRHLPTQASGRWSTYDYDRKGSSVTNWPRTCINQHCPQSEHAWTDVCWSIRDIIMPDDNYILITWDHDNIEGRIHDLIVDDKMALQAHAEGMDLHTITCCDIFGYDYPSNTKNPHTSEEDAEWRRKYHWQGKDTKQRVLAKNFNHGSKYTTSWRFVYKIKGIEQYGINYTDLGKLAKRYIASKGTAWQRKLDIMADIRQQRIARSLYGFRRVFFNSSEETGREGFSHMISSTVTDYNNETLHMLEQWLGDDTVFLHNAHDGDKQQVLSQRIYYDTYPYEDFVKTLKGIIQRDITYDGRSITLTAGVKIHA